MFESNKSLVSQNFTFFLPKIRRALCPERVRSKFNLEPSHLLVLFLIVVGLGPISMCKFFPGASLVHPWCIPGASSVHPRTHWLGPTTCFGPLKSPMILIPNQLDPYFVALGTTLVQLWANLSQLGAIFVQLRSHLMLTWAILKEIATKGIWQIIVFPLVFQCFWHNGLHTNYVTTCDNLNPTWTRFRMSWGQFGDNLT